MTANRIGRRRQAAGLKQYALARQMEDMGSNPMLMSNVESGRVMPTQKDMRKICKALDCTPTDLYDIRDLDYLGTLEQAPAAKREGRGHPGMVEFRVWLRPTEKKELLEALKQLGYRDAAEWYREMRRNTIARWKRIENGKGGRVNRPTSEGKSERLPSVAADRRRRDGADKEGGAKVHGSHECTDQRGLLPENRGDRPAAW